MIYKDHEILARCHYTGNALFALNDDGTIDFSEEYYRDSHDDETLVWYEVEAIDVDSKPYPTTTIFTELKTIEEAKRIIDKSVEYTKGLI